MYVEILFTIALVLLVLEAFNPTKGILAIAGFIAYIYGIWILIDAGQDNFYGVSITNVIILGFVFTIALVLFIVYLKKALSKSPETGTEFLKGKSATVIQWANGSGSVFVDGETWRAVGPHDLAIDEIVTVTDYEKLTLTVEKK